MEFLYKESYLEFVIVQIESTLSMYSDTNEHRSKHSEKNVKNTKHNVYDRKIKHRA